MTNDYTRDARVILTLDAGGTNFVFSAICGQEEIVQPVRRPSHGNNLQLSLQTIVEGFRQIREKCDRDPVAISFAFPGPADYPNGVIEKLVNLPAFNGGVALGPMLQNIFHLPVYINNDGNLFGLGEAIAGFLPLVNRELEKTGSPKRFRNLVGVTLGTGFGGSVIIDGRMVVGDNSAGGEIWAMRNRLYPELSAEEGVSIRGVRNFYAELAHLDSDEVPSPEQLFRIANGEAQGNALAACQAFARMGKIAGDALAHAITLVDGLVVIGGGLAGAWQYFLPDLVQEMNSKLLLQDNRKIDRLEIRCYNYEDDQQRLKFFTGRVVDIAIPGGEARFVYDNLPRTAVGVSRLGTSKAIAIGAYVYALSQLDGQAKS